MTTTRVDVPFWPTSTDNLAWSADNLIAVGGGESIAILVPRLNTKGPNSLLWDSIAQRVNLFTTNEIPFSEPLGSVNWSVGEELSLRHVTKLDWSSPGLGRFGTCALAILHSNHVLVLWECVGQPHIRDKWKRCLIVNHTIQAYYGTSITDDIEMRQVRQRIRSFAWVPAVRRQHTSVDQRLDSRLSPREHYLAVSTDAGDIFILRVTSPHDVLVPENIKWEAKVVFRLRISSEGSTDHSGTYRNNPPPVFGATALAFSDWHTEDCAKFAYVANGRLFVCDARLESFSDTGPRIILDGPQEYPTGHSIVHGPLRFIPKTASLLLFGPDTIISVDTKAAPDVRPQSHHLDGRWDDVSGLAFTADADALSTLNFVSHLSTASSATSTLPLSLLDDDSDVKESHWHNAIHESNANFSASYDLGANVQERTWGITSSPLGDIVATCVTLLPSDSPAHVIQSEQRSVVALTSDFQSTEQPFPSSGGRSLSEDISAETLLHGLRQFVNRGGKVEGDDENKQATRQAVMSTLEMSLPVSVPPLPWTVDDDRDFEMTFEDLHTCLTTVRARLYYESDMFYQRLDRLIEIVMQRQPRMQLGKQQYQHVTKAVLDLPYELCEVGPLSIKLGGVFSAVQAKLESSGHALDPAMVDSTFFVETCSICHQDVVLESLRWSRCAGGHQFSRCTLTFLSIMEPGISKSCRICNALYLNEDALPEFKKPIAKPIKIETVPQQEDDMDVDVNAEAAGQSDASQTDGVEPSISLARLLFAACDVCILCGGKFVA